MSTRREFLCSGMAFAGCCASSASAQTGENDAVHSDDKHMCSTLETFDAGFAISDFLSDESISRVREFKITDFGTFVFQKRWDRRTDGLEPGSKKVVLGCQFMNGSVEQTRKVQSAALEWLKDGLEDLIEFRFDVELDEAQIRIQLGGSANNSFVGRDNLAISKSRQTMNLANFDRTSTIQHEFGHALGLRHEHRFPGAISFREDVVVNEMRDKYGWSRAQTYRNILTPLDENAKCVGDPTLNEESIMMYSIPSRWTTDGNEYNRAGVITERDIRCLVGVYSA